MSVVKTISLPSGDHDALDTERVKYRSSIGMGRALGLIAETIVFASVIALASGPEDWATAKPLAKRTNRTELVCRRDFITTSFERDIGQIFHTESAVGIVHRAGLTLLPGFERSVNHRGHGV
jgi:hypothetical protein